MNVLVPLFASQLCIIFVKQKKSKLTAVLTCKALILTLMSCSFKRSFLNNYIILLMVQAFKACVRYFLSIFIFTPNDRPLKTMKNVFYFIEKALFVLEIFKFL